MIIICINNFGYPLSLELNKQYYFVREKENHYIKMIYLSKIIFNNNTKIVATKK